MGLRVFLVVGLFLVFLLLLIHFVVLDFVIGLAGEGVKPLMVGVEFNHVVLSHGGEILEFIFIHHGDVYFFVWVGL